MRNWLRHRGIDPAVVVLYIVAVIYCILGVCVLVTLSLGGALTIMLGYWLMVIPLTFIVLMTVVTCKTIASQLRVKKRQNQSRTEDKN